MKAERDDLVLRISGALRTHVEVRVQEKTYAPRLFKSKCLSSFMQRTPTPSNHYNESLTPRRVLLCLHHSARCSHGDQTRTTLVVTGPRRPGTPIEKCAKDLRGYARAAGFARDRKCFLTELSRIFEDSNNPMTSFLKKVSPRGSQ
jgi:hypothetical protein